MKIALLGYGKMGKAIEAIAKERGHQIGAIIDLNNANEINQISTSNIDIAIEFSHPDAAFENIKSLLSNHIPVVSGTTGWLKKKNEIIDLTENNQGTFFYTSNYSIGVNLFFKLNKLFANLMKNQDGYSLYTNEIHHTEKKDSPSGTAITIAEGIIENNPSFKNWVNNQIPNDGRYQFGLKEKEP